MTKSKAREILISYRLHPEDLPHRLPPSTPGAVCSYLLRITIEIKRSSIQAEQAWRQLRGLRILLLNIVHSLYRSLRMIDDIVNNTSSSLFNLQRFHKLLFPKYPPFDAESIVPNPCRLTSITVTEPFLQNFLALIPFFVLAKFPELRTGMEKPLSSCRNVDTCSSDLS